MLLESDKTLLDSDTIDALVTEGDLKIKDAIPLSRYPLCLLIVIMSIYTIGTCFIGLLIMRYFIRVQVYVMYRNANFQDATHLYILGSDDTQEIAQVQNSEEGFRYFFFRRLKYTRNTSTYQPLSFIPKKESVFGVNLEKGLSSDEIQRNQKIYGKNVHPVNIPGFFQYMGEELLKGFFLLQYLICIIYIIQKNYQFAGILLGFSLATTAINYFLRRASFQKIKQIAEVTFDVTVIRNGSRTSINSAELVPGDIYISSKVVPCDSIILRGEAHLNEMNLSGEAIPINKFPPENQFKIKQSTSWFNEGSIILDTRGQVILLAVNTGYQSQKGRIIRRVLQHNAAYPDFTKSAIIFLLILSVFAYIIFFAMLKVMLSHNLSNQMIILRALDLIGWSFSAAYPIYFNLCYTASLTRLGWNQIDGNNAQKTIESGKVKTICFDKTGTLTQNTMNLNSIYRLTETTEQQIIANEAIIDQNDIMYKVLASCHAVIKINNQYLGDQLDLKMFLFSQFDYEVPNDESIKFVVKKNGVKLEVLKINQFESKFQCMSVLVRDSSEKKHYVFVKGAPAKIASTSRNPYRRLKELIFGVELAGLRNICFAYKEVNNPDFYLRASREQFEKSLEMLGLICFENQIKKDTVETIRKINAAQINTNIITGDNIYIGIETAMRSEIIGKDEKVIVLTGVRQSHLSQGKYIGSVLEHTKAKIIEEQIELTFQQYYSQTMPIAIDEEFLQLNPPPAINHNIKVYARMKPQSKSKIVKKIKEKYAIQNKDQKLKVSMVGDGANDLMAIKQSDVGIGMNKTDASFGADFTIVQIKGVETIMRQGKATLTNVLEVYRYYGIVNFLKTTIFFIMAYDNSYVNGIQLTYLNYASTLQITLFIALSAPAQRLSKLIPNDNMMSLSSALIYIGQIVIGTGGLILCYWYGTQMPFFTFTNDSSYTDWVYQGYTNTIIFVCLELVLICIIFWVYIGHPFKRPIYYNIVQTIWLILIIIINTALFFLTNRGFLNTVNLTIKYGGALLGLTIATIAIGGIYALILKLLKLQNSE